jgi:signal transduction histidine kinase/CheY-like chemotaxis protein
VHRDFLEQLKETIGVAVNTITANSRTDALLRESQRLTGELQSRQQDLQDSNSELEDKAALLAQQNRDIEIKNAEIEQARLTLEERAQQLALASKVKSEFMANMSHELRTPLNSLLILARLLADNPDANLTPKQVDFAQTIHSAGSDLLQLINDILDLAKIEAGRMDVRNEAWPLAGLVDALEATFQPLAAEKGLKLDIAVSPDAPATITGDEQRVEQVLRNLLSNSMKFTDHGTVTLRVDPAAGPRPAGAVAFAVSDTGIGIAEDKLQLIFEAFQQADGTTSRQFGGTGLGLSISRELTRLLGAELRVVSTPGRGSTFTLVLPVVPVEGDAGVQPVLVDTVDGVVEAVRPADRLDPAAPMGAAVHGGHLHGPDEAVSPTVVVVEPMLSGVLHAAAESALEGLAGIKGRIDIVAVESSEAIGQKLAARRPICVAVDVGLDGDEVRRVLEAVATRAAGTPVLLYESAANDGSSEALAVEYRGRCQTETVHSTAQTVERLTLHLLTGTPRPSGSPHEAADAEPELPRFDGEKILVVDDDIRNVFALTSALEIQGLTVVYASNGRQGIDLLQQHDDISLVLMDIMMPGMDGYATTARIRRLERFRDLPIIAVTAKAMKGDREKSLAAGTNEHVTKPVDMGGLLGLIRMLISS